MLTEKEARDILTKAFKDAEKAKEIGKLSKTDRASVIDFLVTTALRFYDLGVMETQMAIMTQDAAELEGCGEIDCAHCNCKDDFDDDGGILQ